MTRETISYDAAGGERGDARGWRPAWLENRYLLGQLVRHDFRRRYAGSALGMVWALLQPLVYMVLFTLIFAVVLKVRFRPQTEPGTYALYLLAGLLPWLAISESVTRATSVWVENANLIKRVRFPASLLPLQVTLTATLNMLIGFALLTIYILALGYSTALSWLWFPAIVAIQVVWMHGAAMLLAALNAYLRDIQHALGLLLVTVMYLTPIFYPLDIVPPPFNIYMMYNPVTSIVLAYREVLLDGTAPHPNTIQWLLGHTLAMQLLAALAWRRTRRQLADIL